MASGRQKITQNRRPPKPVSIVNTVTDGVARAMHGARLSFPEREKKSLARSYERAAIKKFPLEKKKSWWFL